MLAGLDDTDTGRAHAEELLGRRAADRTHAAPPTARPCRLRGGAGRDLRPGREDSGRVAHDRLAVSGTS